MVSLAPVIHDLKNGCRMLLDPAVPVQQQVIRDGDYDTAARAFALRFLPTGGVFFDIGANIGLWACPLGLAARDRGARGFAFEPAPSSFAQLNDNVTINILQSVVLSQNLGLGALPGQLDFHIEPGGETNNAIGANMLSDIDRETIDARGWQRASSPVVRLDDWAREQSVGRCDLIKIDVEGAEPLVLEGGREFLRATRPTIFGEFNPYWMSNLGWDFARVLAWFEGWNYQFYREVDGAFVPLTPELHGRIDGPMPSYLLLPGERSHLLDAV